MLLNFIAPQSKRKIPDKCLRIATTAVGKKRYSALLFFFCQMAHIRDFCGSLADLK
jgi:hypothetical protein